MEFQGRASLVAGVIFIGFITASSSLAYELRQSCQTFDVPKKGAYCLTETKGSTNPDTLYFFHGKGENENTWVDLLGTQAVMRYWEEIGFQPPRVISISFGAVWLLTDVDSNGKQGLLQAVADQVIPMIERRIGGIQGRRFLFGDSMGGMNASLLFLKRGHLFDRVVLACPAITTVSPYDSLGNIFDYLSRTKANLFKLVEMLLLGRINFPSEEAWNQSAPLQLAPVLLNSSSPNLHVSCGSEDNYGFQEGARKFSEIARDRGVHEVIWSLLPGEHCTFDSISIAEFLARP